MSWDYDVNDVPDNFEGFERPEAGEYHLSVTQVFEDQKGQMVVDMEILAGKPSGQEGKQHREYFTKPKPDQDAKARMNTIKRALTFAIAVGLTTEDEIKSNKDAKKPTIPNYDLAVGRQLCGKLTGSEYQGKVSMKIGYDMWPVDSPKADQIPKNGGMLEKNGDNAADPFGKAF